MSQAVSVQAAAHQPQMVTVTIHGQKVGVCATEGMPQPDLMALAEVAFLRKQTYAKH